MYEETTFLKQHLITGNLLIFISLDNKGVYEEMTFLKQHLITSNLLIFITLDNKGVYEAQNEVSILRLHYTVYFVV